MTPKTLHCTTCAPCRAQHQADHVRKQGAAHHHEATRRVVLCACALQPQNVHHRAVRAHTRHFRAPPDLSPPTLVLKFLRIISPPGGGYIAETYCTVGSRAEIEKNQSAEAESTRWDVD